MSSVKAASALDSFLVSNVNKLPGLPIDDVAKANLASALCKALQNEQDDNSWIDEFSQVLKPDNSEWLSEQLMNIVNVLMEDVSSTSSPACPPTPEKAAVAAPVTPSPPRSASPDASDESVAADAADVPASEASSTAADAAVIAAAPPSVVPITSTSTFKLRPDAKVFTPLRADAKEFVPSWMTSPQQSHSTVPKGSASNQSWAGQEIQSASNGGTSVNVSDADAMSMLSSWFPSYSGSALKAIYELNRADLEATIQDLCNLQWKELDASGPARPPKQQRSPVIADQGEFPALTVVNENGQQAAAKPKPLSFAAIVKQSQAAEQKEQKDAPAANGNGKKTTAIAAPQATTPAEKVEVPWLSTGDAVTTEYTNAREKARDLARVRNACFQQATQAYLAGNKALAKQLSEKGRHHNELMKQAHASASQTIFANRNAQLENLQLSGQAGLVDLHGLHVAEAKRVLEGLINQKNGKSRLLVCVGTGHHTKGSRTPARLSQAVEEFMRQKQLRHRFLQPGLLEVSF